MYNKIDREYISFLCKSNIFFHTQYVDKITDLLREDGLNIRYLPSKIQNDIFYARIAIENNPLSLEFLPLFQDREDLVLYAVSKNPNVIKYISERLKNNYVVMYCAVSQNKKTIIYASEKIKKELQLFL